MSISLVTINKRRLSCSMNVMLNLDSALFLDLFT